MNQKLIMEYGNIIIIFSFINLFIGFIFKLELKYWFLGFYFAIISGFIIGLSWFIIGVSEIIKEIKKERNVK